MTSTSPKRFIKHHRDDIEFYLDEETTSQE